VFPLSAPVTSQLPIAFNSFTDELEVFVVFLNWKGLQWKRQ
jgi:hypothetical protein